MPELAEVLSPQAEQRRAVELCVAADVVVGVRMERLAVACRASLSLRLVLALHVHDARVLQLSFSRGT